MPELVKMLVRHAMIGFGIAAIFVAGLLLSDMGGVGTLMANSDSGLLAGFMLFFFLGLTFGSAQMGFAIMSRDWDDDGKGHRRRARRPLLLPAMLAPVRVKARARPARSTYA